MAIDFTGVTNVFMGGDTVYSADTSLQAVCQGETEQWAYSDQGYVWRVMGSTIDGYDRFNVGDVVCIATNNGSWRGARTTDTLGCSLADNFLTRTSDNYYIDIDGYYSVMTWSDAIGSDGVTIGWHLPDKTATLKMVSHSYVVKQTDNNGAYARLSQGYGSLGTKTINNDVFATMYPLGGSTSTQQWWFTYDKNSYGSNQAKWLYGRIVNKDGTQHYLYSSSNGVLALSPNSIDSSAYIYSVILKRVRIAQ